ncbi:hypothetical protein [Anaerovibrio sp. RM50]|uniref:hypothetical protein n=1 Tax=Anaerovibrio sp. RM50 TaxID=1200557 RepID=UPI00048800EE|nr:hypothetical protein [Anaerovibrio sp. RM50]
MIFEIKMFFKKSSNMEEINKEIQSICDETNAEFISSEDNSVLIGSDIINYFAPAYVGLKYSSIVKNNLVEAYSKDPSGIESCKKGLLTPREGI